MYIYDQQLLLLFPPPFFLMGYAASPSFLFIQSGIDPALTRSTSWVLRLGWLFRLPLLSLDRATQSSVINPL